MKFDLFPKSTSEDDLLTWFFITFNIGRSIIKALAATEDINENRNGELGIMSKSFLMFSYFVQVAMRIEIIILISYLNYKYLDEIATTLMIFLPIIFRWFSLFLFYVCICPNVRWLGETDVRFKSMSSPDKIIHIGSNTFGIKSLTVTHQKPYINLETMVLHLLTLIDVVFYISCLHFLHFQTRRSSLASFQPSF